MEHNHNVIDTDIHYKIDGVTRTIININETKRELVQYDHNSERFTFEIPRYFDGHDFSDCNVVQVHYENTDAYGKNKSEGIYTVKDLHISSEDDNVVVLSWLIAGDATRYVGSLGFSIRFSCMVEEIEEYAWNTKRFDGITILQGVYNSNEVAELYPNVIAQLSTEIKNKADVSEVEELKNKTEEFESKVEVLEESVNTKADINRVKILESKTKDLDNRVTSLENRKIRFTEDTSVAYKKTVPITATGDAQIGRIGGASHIVNLEEYAFFNATRVFDGSPKIYILDLENLWETIGNKSKIVFKTDAGVNFYNELRSVVLHGYRLDPYGSIEFEEEYEMSKNKDKTYSVEVDVWEESWADDETGEEVSAWATFRISSIELIFNDSYVHFDEEYINVTVSAVPSYEWFEPITATKVSKILSKPVENLIPKIKYDNSTNDLSRGIIYTNNLDGSVTMNGQKDSGASFSQWYFVKNLNVDAGRYYIELEGCPDSYRGKITLKVNSVEGDRTVTRSNPYLDFSEQSNVSVRIKVSNNTNFNNVKFTPVFKKADGVTPIDTFEIPEEILNIQYFGEGNPDNPNECNYLDLDRKEVVILGSYSRYSYEWRKFEEPKVYDVSKLLTRDNYIKIIAGGDLEFISDVDKPVPSDVYYMSYISKTTDAEEVTEND